MVGIPPIKMVMNGGRFMTLLYQKELAGDSDKKISICRDMSYVYVNSIYILAFRSGI